MNRMFTPTTTKKKEKLETGNGECTLLLIDPDEYLADDNIDSSTSPDIPPAVTTDGRPSCRS